MASRRNELTRHSFPSEFGTRVQPPQEAGLKEPISVVVTSRRSPSSLPPGVILLDNLSTNTRNAEFPFFIGGSLGSQLAAGTPKRAAVDWLEKLSQSEVNLCPRPCSLPPVLLRFAPKHRQASQPGHFASCSGCSPWYRIRRKHSVIEEHAIRRAEKRVLNMKLFVCL